MKSFRRYDCTTFRTQDLKTHNARNPRLRASLQVITRRGLSIPRRISFSVSEVTRLLLKCSHPEDGPDIIPRVIIARCSHRSLVRFSCVILRRQKKAYVKFLSGWKNLELYSDKV